MKNGLRQPFLQTGMQLHTGRYARLLYTASPLPSLRFLRHWYSLCQRKENKADGEECRRGSVCCCLLYIRHTGGVFMETQGEARARFGRAWGHVGL
jgi:hypothetical protein